MANQKKTGIYVDLQFGSKVDEDGDLWVDVEYEDTGCTLYVDPKKHRDKFGEKWTGEVVLNGPSRLVVDDPTDPSYVYVHRSRLKENGGEMCLTGLMRVFPEDLVDKLIKKGHLVANIRAIEKVS